MNAYSKWVTVLLLASGLAIGNAASAAEELPCPDLELNVLISMENVTAKVLAAVKKGMDPAKALEHD